MQLIVPALGSVNYTETPVELAWVRLVAASGMKMEGPKADDRFDDGGGVGGSVDPIFTRYATGKGKNPLRSSYMRWFDDDFRDGYFLGHEGDSKDAAIKYFAEHIDDAEHTREVVDFNRDDVMGFKVFFKGGLFTNIDDDYEYNGKGIDVPELLQRNGIVVADCQDYDALLKDTIEKYSMTPEKLLSLFMNLEVITRRRKGEPDAD